jgi:hypothetical protein
MASPEHKASNDESDRQLPHQRLVGERRAVEPFGGFKASGVGKHWSLETFSETRWITLDHGGRPYPPMF